MIGNFFLIYVFLRFIIKESTKKFSAKVTTWCSWLSFCKFSSCLLYSSSQSLGIVNIQVMYFNWTSLYTMSNKLLKVRLLVRTTADRLPSQGYTSAMESDILACSPSCIWHSSEYCVNFWKINCRWAGGWQGNQLMLAINQVRVLHFVW